jgi:hypothetical protein
MNLKLVDSESDCPVPVAEGLIVAQCKHHARAAGPRLASLSIQILERERERESYY